MGLAQQDLRCRALNFLRSAQLLATIPVYRLEMRLIRMFQRDFLAGFASAGILALAGLGGVLAAQQPAGAAQGAQVPATQSTPAQTPAPVSTAPTLSVDARLVNIPVVVHDKKGALIQNLTKDNFVLQVDGHPQTIRYFNIDKDLPLTLGLLVDTSLSQRDVIDDERTASSAFLDDMLKQAADKAFVVQFARQTDLLQDVTNSKPKLQAALKQLDSPSFGGSGGSGSSGGGSSQDSDSGSSSNGGYGGHRGGGTTLYDALFLSSDEIMSKQKGRKALVILSDGVDSGSKETLASSIEAAQRADTIVYAIYFKGREGGGNNQSNQRGGFPGGGRGGGIGFPGGGGYPGGRGGGQGRPQGTQANRTDGKKILQRMADETGGRLFEVSKKDTVASIYTQIGDELRAQYRLAFTPDKETASDGYHQIDLTLTKSSPKDLFIQTRDGYYTGN
jgi:VWFA-related protein